LNRKNKRLSGLSCLNWQATLICLENIVITAPFINNQAISKINTDVISSSNPTSSTLNVSNINLKAVATDNITETNAADETGKLIGSFIVKNTINPFNNTEMMVVLVQPNGRVLQPSPWESGTFSTPEGKKIYSCKVKFDYRKGRANNVILISMLSDFPGVTIPCNCITMV
jgi:hypothetical protein